jgi:hypothetical protein
MWGFSGEFSAFSVEDRTRPSAIFEIPWKTRLFVTLEALPEGGSLIGAEETVQSTRGGTAGLKNNAN